LRVGVVPREIASLGSGIRRIVEAKEDWISSTYIVSLEVENVVAPIAAMAALPKNYPIAGCIDDRPARVLKS